MSRYQQSIKQLSFTCNPAKEKLQEKERRRRWKRRKRRRRRRRRRRLISYDVTG